MDCLNVLFIASAAEKCTVIIRAHHETLSEGKEIEQDGRAAACNILNYY